MSQDPDVARIVRWLRLLNQRNAAAVVRDFVPDLRAVIPAPLLQLAWDRLVRQAGQFERVLHSETSGGHTDRVVHLRCAFSQSVREVALGVRLDAGHRIHGFFGYVLTHNTALTYTHIPPYVHPDYFTEDEVVVVREPWAVGGTLTRPVWDGPFPGAVLVNTHAHHGRNGPFNMFRDLAWGLATQGIMVLRYDHTLFAHPERDWHRGHPERGGTAPPMTVQDDVLDDVSAALQMLRTDPACNGQLFAVGHGLGGYLLPRLAHQDGAPLGLVSLFGHVRPPWEVLAEDVARAVEPTNPRTVQEFATLLQGALHRIRHGQYRDDERVAGMSGRYWTDLREHHGQFAIDHQIPIFVVHGEGEPSGGGEAEFERVKKSLEAHPRATFSLYPDLSVWLKRIEEGYDPRRGLGRTQQQPVDQRLIDDLGRWVRTTSVV